MIDGIKILDLDVDGIGMVKIVSFKEIPVERLEWMRVADSPESLISKLFSIVEICLMDPKMIDSFREMEPADFFKFYRQWGIASGVGK